MRICTIKICCSNAYITFMKQYGTKHCCINYQFQIKFLRYLEQAIKYSRHTSWIRWSLTGGVGELIQKRIRPDLNRKAVACIWYPGVCVCVSTVSIVKRYLIKIIYIKRDINRSGFIKYYFFNVLSPIVMSKSVSKYQYR